MCFYVGICTPHIDVLCYIYNIPRQNKRIVIEIGKAIKIAYIKVCFLLRKIILCSNYYRCNPPNNKKNGAACNYLIYQNCFPLFLCR